MMEFPPVLPIDTVIFDFHTTLVDQGDSARWLVDALGRTGRTMAPDRTASLVAVLDVLWDRARDVDPDSRRDFSAAGHRQVFDDLIAAVPGVDPALADALYDTVTDQWRAYSDSVPMLAALHQAGVATVVLSNTGIDIRQVVRREGFEPFLDGLVQSYEVGAVKPDPAIFRAALAAVDAQPGASLMVGDSAAHDSGGVDLGIRTLLLPRTRGDSHGLGTVLGVVAASRGEDLPASVMAD